MKCQKCGTETTAKFCPECGAPMTQEQVPDSGVQNQNTGGTVEKKKHTGLAIAAFVLSFLGPLALIGLVMAIVDIAKDSKKEYKHGLAIAAIVISAIMLLAFGSSQSNKKEENASTAETTTSEEVTTDTNIDEDESIAVDTEADNTSDDTVEEVEEVEEEEPEIEEPQIPKDEFVASCTDLAVDYKNIARDPDSYIGNNYYFTCCISDARESGMLSGYQKYYITYAFDMDKAQDAVNRGWADSISDAKYSGMDTDLSVWMIDKQNEGSEDYVKLLEDDIVTVYGTFNGMTSTSNSLTGEKGEQMALDIKFVDLLAE